MPGGKQYVEVININGVNVPSGAFDPNGVLAGTAGELFLRSGTANLYQSQGGLVWVSLSAAQYQVQKALASASTLSGAGVAVFPGTDLILAANTLNTPGKVLEFEMSLQVSGDGVATLAFGLRLNGIPAFGLASWLPPAATRTAYCKARFQLTAPGAPGDVRFSKLLMLDATSTSGGVMGGSAVATLPFDTTVPEAFDLYANWSAPVVGGVGIVDYQATVLG